MESIEINSPAFEKLAAKLERQYTYARVVIAKRDEQGQVVQEMAMRALNPKAFSALPAEGFAGKSSDAIPQTIHVARTQRVTVELREVHLKRLREVFGIEDDREAVQSAIKFALEKLEKKSMRRV